MSWPRPREQLGYSDEIEASKSEGELGSHSAEPCTRLDPAEHFLDPFADPLAGGIAGMTGGAAVDGGFLLGPSGIAGPSDIGGVLGNMRSNAQHLPDQPQRMLRRNPAL